MFGPDEEGLHHTAIMVQDMDEAIAYFEANGMPLATSCGLRPGTNVDFAFIDARDTLGHMIEIYPKSNGLLRFYQMVRDASVDWDGSEPVRSLSR